MANPTTNYGFVLPSPTDLVTDLPADFDVALQGVDTRLKALQPGTTLGDLAYSSATANTNTRLGIGTTGQILTVAGGVPSWATATGAADNFQLINAGGTALTGAATITVSGISGKNKLFIFIDNASSASASSSLSLRFNADSGSNYNYAGQFFYSSTYGSIGVNDTGVTIGEMGNSAANIVECFMHLDGTNAAGVKPFTFSSHANGSSTNQHRNMNGYYSDSSTISSVSILSNTGNFDAGTIYVYGA